MWNAMSFTSFRRAKWTSSPRSLHAVRGDFVYIGRTVAYRITPHEGGTVRVVVELPERLRLAPSQPFGIVNSALHVASPDASKTSQGEVGNELRVKSFDGISRYSMVNDPLTLKQHLGGPMPVWKVNLKHIAQQATTSRVGPPAQFAETQSRDSLFFTLSARAVDRPPHHENADYDEVILYFDGPGAWGSVTNPGTLTWCPKGTTHWGPGEDIAEGYWAWLLECSDTLRVAKNAEDMAALMETGEYGSLDGGR
jgi:homogentisate 1,2-dioxygenase